MLERSKPIDPNFGEETQIRIKNEVKEMIEKAKIIPRESLNDCLNRVFSFYNEHHQKTKDGQSEVDSNGSK
jgi:hypothetical protein